MAINFPTSLDNFTNPSSGNTLDSPSHSLQHSDLNDAVEAMQRKVGVGTAVAGSASAGQVLTISAAGTSTWSTPTSPGLVLLTTQTFSGATSVTLPNNTFSATYLHYKMFISITSASVQQGINIRMTNLGTPVTSANYDRSNVYLAPSSGATWYNESSGDSQTSFLMAGYNTGGGGVSFEILHPFEAENTLVSGVNHTSTNGFYLSGGRVSTATSYDALQFYPGSGNITGSYSVYGFSK